MKKTYALALALVATLTPVGTLMAAPAYANDNAQKIAVVKKVVDYGDVDGVEYFNIDKDDYEQGGVKPQQLYQIAFWSFSSNENNGRYPANWIAPLASKGLKASIKKQRNFEQDVELGLITNYTEGPFDGTSECEFSDIDIFSAGNGDPRPALPYYFKVLKNGRVAVMAYAPKKFADAYGATGAYYYFEVKLVKENGVYKIDDILKDDTWSYRQYVDYYCRPGQYELL